MGIMAYKGFEPDLTCRGFQYEVGKTYEMEEKPRVCKQGFHFCMKLSDVFRYYPWYDAGLRYCIVEVLGAVSFLPLDFNTGNQVYCFDTKDTKGCTNKIRIVRELTLEEIEEILQTEPTGIVLSKRQSKAWSR